MKKKMESKDQLWLDLELAERRLLSAEQNLKEAKKAYDNAAKQQVIEFKEFRKAYKAVLKAGSAGEAKKAKVMYTEGRKRFNRLVGSLASIKYDDDYRAAYLAVYAKLKEVTGFNVFAHLSAYDGVHLDAIEEHGYMPQAIHTVQAMF